MVNPLAAVYNLFLGFINCLPQPFVAFLYLVCGLFVILGIIKIVKS